MFKKILYLAIASLFLMSCAGTVDSVKRGLTGAKAKSTDEFLIQKKDPLVLPPDYENLPMPDDNVDIAEEISTFEQSFEIVEDNNSQSTSSTESSILKKIRSK